jgi:diguanylate cyclase (GGDEF)-like protein
MLAESTLGITELDPILVIVEANKVTAPVKKVLASLQKHRRSRDFALFQLRDRASTHRTSFFDGSLVKGRGIVQQIAAALKALEVATTFKAETHRARRKLRRITGELQRLRALVVRDDLTCLYNLRFFNRSLETEHSRAIRFGRHYSLIFIDLDGLKEVNTRYGHIAGGQVLKRLGEHLNESLRRIDIPARVGGDEFVVICPETSKLSARILAERIRQGIEELKLHEDKDYPGITASMGVASFPDDGHLPELILERADRALYEAKARGKNVVCCWGDFSPGSKKGNVMGSVHNIIVGGGDSNDDTTD